MAKLTKTASMTRPTMGPEDKLTEMISDAIDLASKQLKDGTAKAQVITLFLKLGTVQSQLELDIMREQKKLLEAKTESLLSSKRTEELFTQAIEAMKKYSGNGAEND